MNNHRSGHWQAERVFAQLTADQEKAVSFLKIWIDKQLQNNQPVFEVDATYTSQQSTEVAGDTVVIHHQLVMFCLYTLGLKPLGEVNLQPEMQIDLALIDTLVPKQVQRYSGADISQLLTELGYSGDLITFGRHGYLPPDQLDTLFPSAGSEVES